MHVILTGNLHSRVFPGGMRDPDYEPMGYLLKKAISDERLISLDVGHAGGTAWVCSPSCGVLSVGGREGDPPGVIERDAQTRPAGHDGWYRVGRITASPPASGNFDEEEIAADERSGQDVRLKRIAED